MFVSCPIQTHLSAPAFPAWSSIARHIAAYQPGMRGIGIKRQGTIDGVGAGGVLASKKRESVARHPEHVGALPASIACLAKRTASVTSPAETRPQPCNRWNPRHRPINAAAGA